MGINIDANDASTVNATVDNNGLSTGAQSLRTAVQDLAATLRLDATDNSNGAGGTPVGLFDLDNNAGGQFEVVDLLGLSSRNNGATVNQAGAITDIQGPIPTP